MNCKKGDMTSAGEGEELLTLFDVFSSFLVCCISCLAWLVVDGSGDLLLLLADDVSAFDDKKGDFVIEAAAAAAFSLSAAFPASCATVAAKEPLDLAGLVLVPAAWSPLVVAFDVSPVVNTKESLINHCLIVPRKIFRYISMS